MGKARQSSTIDFEDSYLLESRRLGADDEMIGYLQTLRDLQTPLSEREERAQARAKALIRGRGWPAERIRAFFLDSDALAQLSGEPEDAKWLPSVVCPTAVLMPRSFSDGLDESELVRVLIHEMVHARSLALPGRSLPDRWYEDIGLYQLREGLTEIVAEEIMTLPVRKDNQLLHLVRQRTEDIIKQAGLESDAIERMSAEEAIWVICDTLGWSLDELAAWIRKNTGLES